MTGEAIGISVIVPGLDVSSMIEPCLVALGASTIEFEEILFFDDGSTDGSGERAAGQGARVIRNGGRPLGPGAGRNRAAGEARGDWLLFVDADVVVQPDAARMLLDAAQRSGAVAAFGSYDDRPAALGIASQYANLRHHFVHQNGAGESATFWAGLGLIRRDIFLEFGGFDENYRKPSIEDIELGSRLVAAGFRICLEKRALATHLKAWTVKRLWLTDIFARAIPWATLIADRKSASAGLNGSRAEQLAAVAAHMVLFGLLVALFSPGGLLIAGLALVVYLILIRRFAALLYKKLPMHAVAGALILHWMYHIYASQIFGWVMLARRGKRLVRQRRSVWK
jgi:GT2 family glycosyltransferase